MEQCWSAAARVHLVGGSSACMEYMCARLRCVATSRGPGSAAGVARVACLLKSMCGVLRACAGPMHSDGHAEGASPQGRPLWTMAPWHVVRMCGCGGVEVVAVCRALGCHLAADVGASCDSMGTLLTLCCYDGITRLQLLTSR